MNSIHYENNKPVMITTPGEMDALEHQDVECCIDFSAPENAAIDAEADRRKGVLIDAEMAEAIREAMMLVADHCKPRLAAYQLLYACGFCAFTGGSSMSIAKRFGMSKQAFEQDAERLLASIKERIRKNPLEKKPEASATHALTNHRNTKI